MSRYTITMDYNDFERFQKRKKELEDLKSEILSCVEYQKDTPIIVHTNKLKEIALRLLPFEISSEDIIIDG